jgi:hypothetical protein
MPEDRQTLLIVAIFMLCFTVILFKRELGTLIYRFLCKFDVHDFKKRYGNQVLKSVKCIYCGKSNKKLHLRFIKGEKKDLDWLYKG